MVPPLGSRSRKSKLLNMRSILANVSNSFQEFDARFCSYGVLNIVDVCICSLRQGQREAGSDWNLEVQGLP
jgi:hypothetical protein